MEVEITMEDGVGVLIGLVCVALIQLIMVIAILRLSDNTKEILRILSDWEERSENKNKPKTLRLTANSGGVYCLCTNDVIRSILLYHDMQHSCARNTTF